jgi:hypothetical protein
MQSKMLIVFCRKKPFLHVIMKSLFCVMLNYLIVISAALVVELLLFNFLAIDNLLC